MCTSTAILEAPCDAKKLLSSIIIIRNTNKKFQVTVILGDQILCHFERTENHYSATLKQFCVLSQKYPPKGLYFRQVIGYFYCVHSRTNPRILLFGNLFRFPVIQFLVLKFCYFPFKNSRSAIFVLAVDLIQLSRMCLLKQEAKFLQHVFFYPLQSYTG